MTNQPFALFLAKPSLWVYMQLMDFTWVQGLSKYQDVQCVLCTVVKHAARSEEKTSIKIDQSRKGHWTPTIFRALVKQGAFLVG